MAENLDCRVLYAIIMGLTALNTFIAGLDGEISPRVLVIENGILIFLVAFTAYYCHSVVHQDEGSVP